MTNEILYSWTFNTKKQKWILWYTITISVAIWLIIWWFLNKIYGLSFVIIILSWLYYFIETNSPEILEVKLTNDWVIVWNNLYDFWDIKSFSVIFNNNKPFLLRLNLTKKWLKKLDLYINEENHNKIKEILTNFIEENKEEELTTTEKITNLLKL